MPTERDTATRVVEIVRRIDAHQQIRTAFARLARGMDRLDPDLSVSGYPQVTSTIAAPATGDRVG
jgi:hypothetical protein